MTVPGSAGSAAAIRRWSENRAAANALEVRELESGWASPERSIAAVLELLDLWGALHGWPPGATTWTGEKTRRSGRVSPVSAGRASDENLALVITARCPA